MKIQPLIDNIVIWRGFGYPHKPNNPWDSKCRLRIWNQNPVIVLFSDLDIPDTGTSITNCCENLATIVQFHYKLQNPIRWFEHYPRHNRSSRQKLIKMVILQQFKSKVNLIEIENHDNQLS